MVGRQGRYRNIKGGKEGRGILGDGPGREGEKEDEKRRRRRRLWCRGEVLGKTSDGRRG